MHIGSMPDDWYATTPWLRPLVFGVRRDYRWIAPYLQRMRLHLWLAYWNPTPGAALLIDGRRVELTPQRLVVVPAGVWFQRRCSGPFDHWWCHFTCACDGIPAMAAVIAADAELLGACRHAWDLAWRLGPRSPASVAANHAVLAGALARLPWPQAAPPLADRGVAGLAGRLADAGFPACANAELARELDMHEKAFCRRFARAMGQPPQSWLRERRLELSAARLAQGTPVAEAAERGGFTDRYHFSRLFRRHHGLPPGRYRRMMLPAS